MTICQPLAPSLDICPTEDQIVPQLLALLPRGRAFCTNDGPPPPTTTIYKFWAAVARVWAYVNERICDLRKEFFCATAVETLDMWQAEFGVPDGCDPFPNLCAKVQGLAGVSCSYYAAAALAAGWMIQCLPYAPGCAARVGCAQTGSARTGRGTAVGAMQIGVSLPESPAYKEGPRSYSQTGCMRTGQALSCGPDPDVSALECLLARMLPAHVKVTIKTYLGGLPGSPSLGPVSATLEAGTNLDYGNLAPIDEADDFGEIDETVFARIDFGTI